MKSFFVLLFLARLGFAQEVTAQSLETSREAFTVEKTSVNFVSISPWHWTLSESCLDLRSLKPNSQVKPEQFKCEAARALRESLKKDIQITGGQNPGAVICNTLNAKVVYALRKGSQITVCQFADGSMVSNGSLSYAHFQAKKSDHK
jgi:hypothetical protein